MKKETKPKCLLDIEWTNIWASLRYFMGRETIASATWSSDIIRTYYTLLTKGQKESIVKELKAFKKDFGYFGNKKIDNPIWEKFLGCLDEENHKTVVDINNESYVVFEANDKIYPLHLYLERPYHEIFLPKESVLKWL